MKYCGGCKAWKPATPAEFYRDSNSKDGLRSRCRDCALSYNQSLRERDQAQDLQMAWSRSRDIHIRSKCSQTGIPYDLDPDYINSIYPADNRCPIEGCELKPFGGRTDDSPSIDRIIPELGYVRGNVQILSYKANRAKNDSSPETQARHLYHSCVLAGKTAAAQLVKQAIALLSPTPAEPLPA